MDHGSKLERLRATRVSVRGPHVTVHYDSRQVVPEQADTILETRERALALAAAELGVERTGFRASVHVYGDKDGSHATISEVSMTRAIWPIVTGEPSRMATTVSRISSRSLNSAGARSITS